MRAPADSRNAFTMIELMVVLMALGILVAMVVAIGKNVAEEQNRRQTATVQEVVIGCIDIYRSVNGQVPPRTHSCSMEDSPYDECYHGGAWPGGENTEYWRMRGLIWELRRVPECEEALMRLGARFFRTDEEGLEELASGAVFDAYNRAMDWDPEGGFNNGPVVISAGPDGKFGLVDRDDGSRTYRPSTEDSLKEQEDNIRTDGKTME